jgi:hypothetical protein
VAELRCCLAAVRLRPRAPVCRGTASRHRCRRRGRLDRRCARCRQRDVRGHRAGLGLERHDRDDARRRRDTHPPRLARGGPGRGGRRGRPSWDDRPKRRPRGGGAVCSPGRADRRRRAGLPRPALASAAQSSSAVVAAAAAGLSSCPGPPGSRHRRDRTRVAAGSCGGAARTTRRSAGPHDRPGCLGACPCNSARFTGAVRERPAARRLVSGCPTQKRDGGRHAGGDGGCPSARRPAGGHAGDRDDDPKGARACAPARGRAGLGGARRCRPCLGGAPRHRVARSPSGLPSRGPRHGARAVAQRRTHRRGTTSQAACGAGGRAYRAVAQRGQASQPAPIVATVYAMGDRCARAAHAARGRRPRRRCGRSPPLGWPWSRSYDGSQCRLLGRSW